MYNHNSILYSDMTFKEGRKNEHLFITIYRLFIMITNTHHRIYNWQDHLQNVYILKIRVTLSII